MTVESPGEWHFKYNTRQLDPDLQITDELRRRAGQRMIEEYVELCLELGVSPQDIQIAVTDALHNEAKKQGVYPSKLKHNGEFDRSAIIGELADVTICLDYIRYLCGFAPQAVNVSVWEKLQKISAKIKEGLYTLVDLNLYKKANNR